MAPAAEDFDFIKRQDAVVEPFETRIQRYLRMFDIDGETRERFMSMIEFDINQGRVHNQMPTEPRGDMYMLDTCVRCGPSGDEKGVFYAVDFGGTNLRMVRAELLGNGEYKMDQLKRNILTIPTKDNLPKGLMDAKATARELFDTIAALLLELMAKHGDDASGEIFKVGFTFSFALNQLAIDRAEALAMSKGFQTGSGTNDPVVRKGTDIVLLLNTAFQRLSVPARAVAVLNDTTGTLVSGAYSKPKDYPDALIGMIVGTGFNLCYVDPDAGQYNYKGLVINTEAGAMKKGLPRNIVDHEVDDISFPMGTQLCEKMISGLYLPELCRRLILKACQEKAPPRCWAHYSMTAQACATIAFDPDAGLANAKRALTDQLEWPAETLTKEVVEGCHQLCLACYRRSASVLACVVATFAKTTGRLQPALGGVTVCVDGSVYTCHPEYRELFREELERTLGKEISDLIKLTIANDGSGLGAAILAASAHHSSTPNPMHSGF